MCVCVFQILIASVHFYFSILLLFVIYLVFYIWYIFNYRRLAIVEENTELAKTAKLAQVFKDIFTAVTSCKGKTVLFVF